MDSPAIDVLDMTEEQRDWQRDSFPDGASSARESSRSSGMLTSELPLLITTTGGFEVF